MWLVRQMIETACRFITERGQRLPISPADMPHEPNQRVLPAQPGKVIIGGDGTALLAG
jgi:hypothetical protein